MKGAVAAATGLAALILMSAGRADEHEPAAAAAPAASGTTADRRDAEREALEPAVPAPTMDRLELDTTEVTGNRELPKVLYIVPWRKADPGDLEGRPVNSLIEEVLAPLDREEFIRQVDYYSDLADTPKGEESEDRR